MDFALVFGMIRYQTKMKFLNQNVFNSAKVYSTNFLLTSLFVSLNKVKNKIVNITNKLSPSSENKLPFSPDLYVNFCNRSSDEKVENDDLTDVYVYLIQMYQRK